MTKTLLLAVLAASSTHAQTDLQRSLGAASQGVSQAEARQAQPRAMTPAEFKALTKALTSLIPRGKSKVEIAGKQDSADPQSCTATIEREADGNVSFTTALGASYLSGFYAHPGGDLNNLPDLVLHVDVKGGDIEVLKPLYQADSRTRLSIVDGKLKRYALAYPSKDGARPNEPEIVCKF